MSDKMTLREVLAELQTGAPVKLGLKSGYYYCGPLPENWEGMIEEEHRRDMRYFCKLLDTSENKMITFTQRWNVRLTNDIEEVMQKPGTPAAVEADVAEVIKKNHDARLVAWNSLMQHKPGYIDRHVTAIYDSTDPDEEPGTICVLVDGMKAGKYYTSKEYREGTGSQVGRSKGNV